MIKEISKEVAKHFGIKESEMLMKRGFEKVRIPRHVACYFTKKYTALSLASIGYELTNWMAHSTVLNSIKRVQNLIDTKDSKYYNSIMELDEIIYNLINGTLSKQQIKVYKKISKYTVKCFRDSSFISVVNDFKQML